jgi:flagellum-specific ATP synthase
MATMIRIGAYRAGSDPDTDRAIRLRPEIEEFLAQPIGERLSETKSFAELARIVPVDAKDEDWAP